MSRLLSTILMTMFLAACIPLTPAPVEAPLATPGVPVQANWTIRFTQSGGIMGMMREMEITSDGNLKVTDDRTGKTVTGQLTAGELAQLSTLMGGLAYDRPSGPTSCADCFNYTVEIGSDTGKTFTAQADDTTLEASGLSPLAGYLRTLMENALKTQG